MYNLSKYINKNRFFEQFKQFKIGHSLKDKSSSQFSPIEQQFNDLYGSYHEQAEEYVYQACFINNLKYKLDHLQQKNTIRHKKQLLKINYAILTSLQYNITQQKNDQTKSKNSSKQVISLSPVTQKMLFFQQQMLSQLIKVNKIRERLSSNNKIDKKTSTIQKTSSFQFTKKQQTSNKNQFNQFFNLNQNQNNSNNNYFQLLNKKVFPIIQSNPHLNKGTFQQYSHYPLPKIIEICLRYIELNDNYERGQIDLYQNQTKQKHWKTLQYLIRKRMHNCSLKDYFRITYIILQTYPSIYKFNYKFIDSLLSGLYKQIPLVQQTQSMQLFFILSQSIRQNRVSWQNQYKYSETNNQNKFKSNQEIKSDFYQRQQLIQLQQRILQKVVKRYQQKFILTDLYFKEHQLFKLCFWIQMIIGYKNTKLNKIPEVENIETNRYVIGLIDVVIQKYKLNKKPKPRKRKIPLLQKNHLQFKSFDQIVHLFESLHFAKNYIKGQQKAVVGNEQEAQNRRKFYLLKVNQINLAFKTILSYQNVYNQITQKFTGVQQKKAQSLHEQLKAEQSNEQNIEVQGAKQVQKEQKLKDLQNKWKILSIINEVMIQSKQLQIKQSVKVNLQQNNRFSRFPRQEMSQQQQDQNYQQKKIQYFEQKNNFEHLQWHQRLIQEFNIFQQIDLTNQLVKNTYNKLQVQEQQTSFNEDYIQKLYQLGEYQLKLLYEVFDNAFMFNNSLNRALDQQKRTLQNIDKAYKRILEVCFYLTIESDFTNAHNVSKLDKLLNKTNQFQKMSIQTKLIQIIEPQTIRKIMIMDLLFSLQYQSAPILINYIRQVLSKSTGAQIQVKQKISQSAYYIRDLQFLFYHYLTKTNQAFILSNSNSLQNDYDELKAEKLKEIEQEYQQSEQRVTPNQNKYEILLNRLKRDSLKKYDLDSFSQRQNNFNYQLQSTLKQLIQALQKRNLQTLKYLKQKNIDYDNITNAQNTNNISNFTNSNKYFSHSANPNYKNINQVAQQQNSKLLTDSSQPEYSKSSILMGNFIMKCINKERKQYLKNESIVKLTKFFTEVKAFKEIKFCYPMTNFLICPHFVFYPSKQSQFKMIVLSFLQRSNMTKPQTLVLKQMYRQQNIQMELIDIDQFLNMHINQRLQRLRFIISEAQKNYKKQQYTNSQISKRQKLREISQI